MNGIQSINIYKRKNGFKVLISKNNGFKVSISKIIDMIPIQLQRLITWGIRKQKDWV